jgi:FAD/FMN-containing dehydrogenase
VTSTAIDGERVAQVATTFSGELLMAGDAGYEEARRVHNGLIDKRPALIARCRGTADVVDALRLARACGLEVSVRGGGHNVAGRCVTEGGVMIDLAPMTGIHVDAGARTLRAQGGVLWSELNREAALHGLAVTGGAISSTGIAGLTLGGGLGYLMSLHGLAADNLIGVELVTADGAVLEVDDGSYPDLMWALRGGGGNFGVAASLVYRLHPVGTVVGGIIAHPFDAAGDVLRFVRDRAEACPDALTVFPVLAHAPDGSGVKLAAMLVCHAGDPGAAERDLAPYRAFGSPVMAEVGPMPYPVINTILDANYPAGSLNYWLSAFTDGLGDGLIDAAIERFAAIPTPMGAIVLERFHGAVTRIGATATAVPHRDPGWNLLLPTVWTDPATTEANIAWTRDTYAALREHFTGARWLNYLNDEEGERDIRGAYGPNYERLVEVKRRYDPENVFHLNHNIAP